VSIFRLRTVRAIIPSGCRIRKMYGTDVPEQP
jgi:hypothetical protein